MLDAAGQKDGATGAGEAVLWRGGGRRRCFSGSCPTACGVGGGEAAVFDERAAVHDDGEAGVPGEACGLMADDAGLQPETASADGGGLFGDGGAIGRGAKHIHQVDGLRD